MTFRDSLKVILISTGKRLRILGLPKQNTTRSLSYHLAGDGVGHLCGRERHLMRPFALRAATVISPLQVILRITIDLLASTLNCAAAFSIAAASSDASASLAPARRICGRSCRRSS